MADLYGKLDFSRVQRCRRCFINPTDISAISNPRQSGTFGWQLANSQTKTTTQASRRLRGEIGGCR